MLPIQLDLALDEPLRLLCIGAHCDDIEIGAGATIRRLLADRTVDVSWLVLASDAERRAEALESAAWFCSGAREVSIEVDEFPASYLPEHWGAVKRRLHQVVGEFDPQLVLTHRLEDRHQDHRLLAELTWQACRDRTILEYEIAKWEGDLGHPNVFVTIEESAARAKAEAIQRCFPSQASRDWFEVDAFLGLMRLRGVECASPTRYAEAFHARKLIL